MSRIEATLTEGYSVTLRTSEGHEWAADEPENVGGADTGPNPYELLLGALASCTCITVSMYCQRKGWTLRGITARYAHDRIHADDCAECENDRAGYIDRIHSEITIDGDLDEDQRRTLARVAASCPVHKTLGKSIHLVDDVDFASLA